jgi:Putative adhesin
MNTTTRCLLAATGLAAIVSIAHAKIERTVEKTFTVQPGGTLYIETSGGNISVQPAKDAVVRITAKQKINASSEAEADELLEKLTLMLEQTGNDVSASAKYEKRSSGFNWRSWPPVQVDFVVTVPASFATNLKTSGGNIVLGDLEGKVHARTSGGDIKIGTISATVDAGTSGGNVTLTEAKGSVKLHTSGGDILVGKVAGSADLQTSGGDIKIDAVENTLRARTSGGDVNAGIFGLLKGDCELATSGGNVTAMIDKGASFRLDASTSGGRVTAERLTITLEESKENKSRLVGDVNQGGPLLKLRSSGGDIRIKTR